MKRVGLSVVHVLVVMLLAACSSRAVPAVTDTVLPPAGVMQAETVTELVVETPEQGKATITGRLLSAKTRTPLAQTAVRLAEVYRQGEEGAYVLDGSSSPGAYTNAQGEFVIPNIDPKEYVIVAGDPYASNDVVKEAAGKPKPYSVAVNQVLNVGTVEVDLVP